MKGNYIGVKPSPYSKAQSRKQGVWEIYDQEELAKTSSWQVQAPWDVSTGYFNLDPLLNRNWFQVGTGETGPHEIVFKPDGTRFYITGNGTDRIYQYHCSTPWDIRTAYCSPYNYSVTNQDATPLGLYIKPDGAKLYVVGQATDQVYEYDFIVPWEVGTLTYTGKSFSIAAQEGDSRNVVFKDDGTKFYVVGGVNDTVYQYSCSTAWDVSTASYDSKSFSVAAQDTDPQSIVFKDDGTKFYVAGNASDTVYQYSCSTAWDVSTASYDSKSFATGTQDATPLGLYIKPDGSKFYIVGDTTDSAYQYTCSTPWDISTGKFDAQRFSVSAKDATPYSIIFKTDGTKFYALGGNSDTIYQYNCSTAWDLTTASYDSKSFSVTTQETAPTVLTFKDDGTKFYVVGNSNDTVHQYSCSTAWDISTASYDSKSFSVAAQDGLNGGLVFKDDGTKFYLVGYTNDTVYQYSCSTAWDVSTASYDSKSFSVAAQDTEPRGIAFKPDGTKFYVIGQLNDRIYQYSCSTAWDISTGAYDSVYVSNVEATAWGLTFKPDGTKFYVLGTNGDAVFGYTLQKSWDVLNAYYDQARYAATGEDTSVQGITFKTDGTKFYIVGVTTDTVYQYTCATPWLIATATRDDRFCRVALEDTAPHDIYFKLDGTAFYIIGDTNNTVYQYTCSTAWDVGSANYSGKSFGVGTEEASPYGLTFKTDGTKFYIVGDTNNTVYQYSCSTAWDISTASYESKSFNVNSQETTPRAVAFKDDGTKFYVIGTGSDTVYQYSCSTAWDVSTASYDSKSFSAVTNLAEGTPTGLAFGYNGSILYVTGSNGQIYQVQLT